MAVPAEFAEPRFVARRRLNWILLGLLYALFYATRYNYTAVSAQLADRLGWTNTELGVFETVMPLVYGLSVFLNGPLADRVGGRRAFLFGAAGVTACNLAFGACLLAVRQPALWSEAASGPRAVLQPAVLSGLSMRQLLSLMAVLWGCNGYFQSFGALAIVKVNAQWFHVRERGSFAAIFGVLIRFGLILAFSGVPLVAGALGLGWAFWLPSAAVAVVLLLNHRLMRDTPTGAGLPPIDTGDDPLPEKPSSEKPGSEKPGSEKSAPDDAPARVREVLAKVFASRAAWTIALGSMMIGFVRRSVVDAWYPKYFVETYGLAKNALGSYWPYQLAAWGIALLGIAGGFAFGISSDRVYRGRRAPVVTYGFVGMAVMLALFGLAHHLRLGPVAAASCLMLLSFCVNGAHGMIGGAASMDFGGRKAAATAAGLFDGVQYLAGAFVGVGVGKLVDRWGWSAWPFAPIPFALLGAAMMATLWNATPASRRH